MSGKVQIHNTCVWSRIKKFMCTMSPVNFFTITFTLLSEIQKWISANKKLVQ